jgi:hypothetical protein
MGIRTLCEQARQEHAGKDPATSEAELQKFKRRMLEWPNPVEFVNNMYGCHPDDEGNGYFKKVFSE